MLVSGSASLITNQAYSREANDIAQIFFALYVAVAITAATRARAHLAADAFARRFDERWRQRIWRAACALILIPASALILYAGSDVWRAVAVLERFPDTLNPGYFLIRVAGVLLAALVLAQAVLDLVAREPPA